MLYVKVGAFICLLFLMFALGFYIAAEWSVGHQKPEEDDPFIPVLIAVDRRVNIYRTRAAFVSTWTTAHCDSDLDVHKEGCSLGITYLIADSEKDGVLDREDQYTDLFTSLESGDIIELVYSQWAYSSHSARIDCDACYVKKL